MSKKKKNNWLFNAYWFFRFKIPAYITLIALYGLAYLLLLEGKTEFLFTSLLVVIGISVTTSQTCFTYIPSIRENKIKGIVKKAGEHFLAASIWMSIAILILFVSMRYDLLVKDLVWYFKIPSYLFYSFALLHFTYSADSINKGVHRIGYILWWKLEDDF
jgi:hypothetical protein